MKAIIFDLNGVFISGPLLSDRFRDDFNVPIDNFLDALKEIMAKVRMPNAPEVYELFIPYLEKWNVKLSKQEFYNYWFGAENQNEKLIEFAKTIKDKGIKLFVLSNNLKERSAYYDVHFPFIDEVFDKTYYSWQTGLVKPDTRAYELILQENNLKPEDCLYFDDSEKNVEAAKSLGINAFTFTNPEDVIGIINKSI